MSNMFIENLEPRTATCAVCGKKFEIPYYVTDWGYRFGGRLCCGYRCMRKAGEKERQRVDDVSEYYAPQPKKVRKRTPEEVRQIEAWLRAGNSIYSACLKFNRSDALIREIKRGLMKNGSGE